MRTTPAGPQPDLRAVARPLARTRCARAPLSPNLSVSVFCGLVVIVLVGWGEGSRERLEGWEKVHMRVRGLAFQSRVIFGFPVN